jgi:acyl-CoA reductase-like NAD-dependent aldehyde dehydrogenase
VDNPGVNKVVFTGSTEVGKAVMAGCAAQVKPVTLELGGKSANIVFADADLEQAAATAPYAVFDNAGQDCCARSRILVQRSVFDRFLELLEPAVKGVRVEDPALDTAEMGPLITAAHREKVASYVPEDAPVAFRGEAPSGSGFWFPPTVLAPVSPGDRAAVEEIFGPVVAVIPFDDEADAVRVANDSPYGLSGSIWTENVGRALRVSRAVETGALSVNSHSSVRYWTPFGGFKQSGLGRELGPDALDAFTEVKNVFIATEGS